MKNLFRNLIILISPFLLMIAVNEGMRKSVKEKPYSMHGITAINSAEKLKDKCSWYCHNNTTYCKQQHVKFAGSFFKFTDPIYFGIIGLLAATGSYGLANIIFLVILWPLVMFYLLIKILDMRIKIKQLKQK